MSTEVQAAVIAGAVGLVTALIGTAVTVLQARRERSKWLIDFKGTTSLELYRQRLSCYPEIFKIIGRLSHGAEPAPDGAIAGQVALDLNAWIYGLGGLCAETGTRGALIGLRSSCFTWARSGTKPTDVYEWRNLALTGLRLDIDLDGLEDYDFDNMASTLKRISGEVDQMMIERTAMPRPSRHRSTQS